MRAKAALSVLLVAGCGGSVGGATELLPDLVQSPPRALEVYESGETWRLAFLSAVENDGRGPMLLLGRRPDEDTPAMGVEQLVRRTDGSAATYPVDGEIRFVESETHRHWHFLDFERYDILTANGKAVGRDQKTGFCLGDRYNASGSVPRLEGQWIDITDLPAGRYALRHRVNLDRALRESDYGNNSAEVPFDLSWSDSGTPTVSAVYDG
jgi:hypothetical protein